MPEDGQKLLVKMYTYRVMGVVFAFVGLCFFAVIYTHKAEGNFVKLFEDPLVILWMAAPFLPSSLMFFLVGRTEKKLRALLEQKDKSA